MPDPGKTYTLVHLQIPKPHVQRYTHTHKPGGHVPILGGAWLYFDMEPRYEALCIRYDMVLLRYERRVAGWLVGWLVHGNLYIMYIYVYTYISDKRVV